MTTGLRSLEDKRLVAAGVYLQEDSHEATGSCRMFVCLGMDSCGVAHSWQVSQVNNGCVSPSRSSNMKMQTERQGVTVAMYRNFAKINEFSIEVVNTFRLPVERRTLRNGFSMEAALEPTYRVLWGVT